MVEPEVNGWIADEVNETDVRPVFAATPNSQQRVSCCREKKASGNDGENLADQDVLRSFLHLLLNRILLVSIRCWAGNDLLEVLRQSPSSSITLLSITLL